MLRYSYLLASLFICCCFAASYFTPSSSSQSTLRSLSLNGTNQYLTAPSSTSLNITGAITVEGWIKLNSNTAYQAIISREAFQQSGTGGGYRLVVTDTGKLRLDLFQTHNTYTTVIGTTTITTGVWHHVTGVFDGSQMRVYVDGVSNGSVSTTSGPASGTGGFYIGRFSYSFNPYYFGGLIDEVRVSGAALYTSNFTPGTVAGSNVKGFWKFDGSTPNDSSGNGNNGTLQNGATYSTDVPPLPNNAPSVSLTHPLNNTSIAAGANIVLDATASDSDGSVSKVDFYQGTTLLGTDTSAPYSFTWTNVSAGAYSLTAKATDDGNATTTSTAVAVTVTASGSAHSLSLNGTTASADVPNHNTLNITGAITLEAWIKFNAIDGNNHDIVSRIDRNTAGSGGGYSLTVNTVGKLRLDLFQTHNTYTTVIGTTVMSPGVWHHVAGVFDGSQMRVYLNGVLDGSLNTTNGPGSGTSLLRIGKAAHAANTAPLFLPAYAFAGLIDEVRVSAAALYTSNFTPGSVVGSNVKGLWKFDGQTANDFSGNGNNGTLQNSATYSTDVPSIGGGSQPPVPVANGPYNGQVAQAVQFSSSGSADPGGSIVSYHWNFGDSTTASTANPSHTYAAPGLYTATLTVTDNSGLLASATATVTIGNGANSRLDPLNQTGGSGENPLSRNFNWTLPLVNLPGRAGMDLSLSLSYNSLVWTKTGSYISFDDDHGFPGPGFRLGFPVIQPLYYNAEVGKYAFLVIGTDGSRTELRQVASSTLYEAADSSYLLLDAGTMILRSTDGTQLKYELKGSEYQCTEIKDRNGNYITVNYTAFGRIDTVIDTLGRSIKFNYDANGWPTSITQIWNQGPSQVTHNWATFEYTNTTIQTNFTGLTLLGASNGSAIKTLSKVTLADGSHFDFSYTSWGQVWKVSSFAADNHLLNYRSYNLPQTASAQTDCPRFTERRDWAESWNQNISGVEQEAVTTYAEPATETSSLIGGGTLTGVRAHITAPDLTSTKIYFIDPTGTDGDWQRGLPALVNTYDSSGTLQRQVKTTWTQDNTSVSYKLNPRVTETNTYDPAGNRARVQMTYQQLVFANGTSCQLPRDVYEYAANAATILRSTRTDYHTGTAYSDRRIIGLVTERRLYEGDVNSGGVLMSKIGFFYDNENGSTSIEGTDAPIQHDNTNYTASFVTGRANLSSVRRFDVTNTAQFTTTRNKFNTAGAVVSASDASNHTTQLSYVDSFSDSNNSRNTLAYPTTVTDPDVYTATVKYQFDFGAVTSRRTPQPNTTQNLPGPEQTLTYDTIGRPQQVTNQVNGAYTRFVYANTMTRLDTYATIQDGLGEAHSFKFNDGAGRVIATATQHPGSIGGYSGQKFVYDVMGRRIKSSNPTETSASGAPSQWVTAGDDAAAGWIYTQQTYDWKGRPLVTTNQDGTTKIASYSGCGCAGGEVATLTDEGTVDGGVAKRRQQKIYSDVLGRVIKNETLNWEGGAVYSAAVNTYNARDQVTLIREYAGPEGSPAHQDTTMTYDGYGRLQSRHVPEQNATASTTWTYNADDTFQSVTDARGATATYGYNARHLLTSINYSAPAGITPTANAAFGYDAAGNRTSMSDGSGSTSYQYDSLLRLTSETRQFTGPGVPAGNFTLSYEYTLAGAVKKVTDERASTSFSTSYDAVGRISSVTAVGYAGTNTTFISGTQYRAWGSPKAVVYGNGTTLDVNYDNRLRVAAQVVSGFKMSWVISPPVQPFSMQATYQYYADGRLKFVTRQNPSGIRGDLRTHDRAFEYDHTGRVREAYSGVEAHQFLGDVNSGVAQGPYRLSFTYDAWDNLLSGGGRYWSRTNETNNLFDTQNRNPDWEYDPDGRLLSQNESPNAPPSQPLRVTYDAGGQSSVLTQVREYFEPAIQQMVSISLTNSQTFDGDGALVRYKKEHLYSTLPANNNVEVTFHLRSTVLGGAGISEYNGSGSWQRGHVYAGGEAVGEQTKSADGSQARAIFRQRDPLMGDELNSRENGDFGGESVIDPQGVDVAGSDPFPADGSGDPDGNVTPAPFVPAGRGEGMLIATGESGMKCVLDGITVDCASVGSFAVQCPENDCGPRRAELYDLDGNYIGGIVTNPFQAFTDGWSGFTLAGTRYVGGALILDRSWTGGPSERIGSDELGFGTLTAAYSAHFIAPPEQKRKARRNQRIRRPADDLPSRGPQNPLERRLTSKEYSDIRSRIETVLKSKDCRDFIDTLVTYAQGLQNPPGGPFDSAEDFLPFADFIFNASDGGMFWRPAGGGQVGHKFWISNGIRADLNVKADAGTLMHLLIHGLQGRIGSDDTLAFAIRDLGIVPKGRDGKPLPFPTGPENHAYSIYWDTALQNACFPNVNK